MRPVQWRRVSAAIVVVKDFAQKNILSQSAESPDEYIVTSNPKVFATNANRFYKIENEPKLLNI